MGLNGMKVRRKQPVAFGAEHRPWPIAPPSGTAVRLWTCPQCHYDLTGLLAAGACPECGLARDAGSLVIMGWDRRSFVITGPGAGLRVAIPSLAIAVVSAVPMAVGAGSATGNTFDWARSMGVLLLLFVPVFAAAVVLVVLAGLRAGRRPSLTVYVLPAGVRFVGRGGFPPLDWSSIRRATVKRSLTGLWRLDLRRKPSWDMFSRAMWMVPISRTGVRFIGNRRDAALVRRVVRRRLAHDGRRSRTAS